MLSKNVSSINIEETGHWTQMWMYYFLMGNKPIYLKYSTSWDASPLKGEWTLKSNLDIINVTIRNDPILINDCCYLEKNVIFNATYGDGWSYPESNDTLRWRWTGQRMIVPPSYCTCHRPNKSIWILPTGP